jgi:membrane protein
MALKSIWNLLKASVTAWIDDKAPRLGAALSFYTVFALPPLFMIAIFIASLVFNPDTVRTDMFSEVGGLIGKKSAEAIQSAMAAQYQSDRGAFASVAAIVTLVLTATGMFIELQDALNTIWKVEAKPGHGLSGFVRNRLMSFAMVVGIGFLLLVSLVVSAALAALSGYVNELLPGFSVLSVVASALVSFIVITVLFALIFKILPDVKIAWRDVWIGGALTSLLFTLGKFLLGWYLGRSTTISAYGAAGSLVLILLWVYYSAQILFFGAEVTKVYATRFGKKVQPASYARWVSVAPSGKQSEDRSMPSEPPSHAITGNMPDRQAQLISELRQEVESLRSVVHHLKSN